MGVTAALYATLTIILAPISYGQFQVRVSESLTLLPLLFPETVVGLTVGCLVANFFGNGILDIVFGTLATLVSSLLVALFSKIIKPLWLKIGLSALCVSVINAIVVPFTYLAVTDLKTLYFINAAWIFLGEAVSSGILGTLVFVTMRKLTLKSPLRNESAERFDKSKPADRPDQIDGGERLDQNEPTDRNERFCVDDKTPNNDDKEIFAKRDGERNGNNNQID